MSAALRAARRPQLGKWFLRVSWMQDAPNFDPFVRRFEICCIKKVAQQPENAMPVHGKHYKGFRFAVLVRLPFYVGQWR